MKVLIDMKVLAAESLELAREHLSGLLVEAGDLEVRFAEQTATPLMQTATAWQSDVVILDFGLRGTIEWEDLIAFLRLRRTQPASDPVEAPRTVRTTRELH